MAFYGRAFQERDTNGPDTILTVELRLEDTDLVRGNTPDETASFLRIPGFENTSIDLFNDTLSREISASVTFSDGTTVDDVLGLTSARTSLSGRFSRDVRESYVFEEATLAALGKNITDISDVSNVSLVDHNLSWAQLGFQTNPPANSLPEVTADNYLLNTAPGAFFVPASLGVLANDTDPEGADLTVTLERLPNSARVEVYSDGSFSFAADRDLALASFSVRVSDGEFSVVEEVRVRFSDAFTNGLTNVPVTEGIGLPLPANPNPPEPQPDPDPLNIIDGTDRGNRLNGTDRADIINGFGNNDRINGRDGDDILIGGDGNDRLTGGTGSDTFIFGADALDLTRDFDRITDFQLGVDTLVLEDGASIRRTFERNGDLHIQLNGDRDKIILRDQGLEALDDIVFVAGDFIA